MYGNHRTTDKAKAYLLCFGLILFFGLRPISDIFVDTPVYAHLYDRYIWLGTLRHEGEWLWNWILTTCADIGLSVHGWFTVISFLYIGILLWAAIRISANANNNAVYLLFLFFVSAFLFWSGAVNGLRIGLASSVFILAFTYVLKPEVKEKAFAFLLFFLAISIHSSIALTILCIICSFYVFKSIKYPVIIWFVSIILLLLFGNFFVGIIEALGLFSADERMESYLLGDRNDADFVLDRGGFRFDFLLYSFAPIAFGWYLIVKKGFTDRFYIILLNTYILANAFWILLMYVMFSNRFASLSWFLYPLLWAYPLIKFRLWDNQRRIMALILFANMFFTYFMARLR